MTTLAAALQVEDLVESNVRFVEGSADPARQTIDVVILEEGFGNQRDNHYYSRSLLESSYGKFGGVAIYSNHLTRKQQAELDGQPRPWEQKIGRILPGTTRVRVVEGTGQTVGTALIANPLAWAYIQADPEILQLSINARGATGALQLIEGRQGKPVESIAMVKSVDVVSEAGAGGRFSARALQETARALGEDFIEGKLTEQETDVDPTDAAQRDDTAVDDGADTTTTTVVDLPEEEEEAVEADVLALLDLEDDADWDSVEEGELEGEPVEDDDGDETLGEADEDFDEDIDDEEGEEAVEARAGGRRSAPGRKGQIPGSSRSGGSAQHPPNWGKDTSLKGDLAGRRGDTRGTPHPRSATRPATARALAAQMEAQIEERVEARLAEAVDEALDAAEARFHEHVAALRADHERELAQRDQREIARGIIEAATDLPVASRRRLMVEFHDFLAEADDTDGQERTADTVLREAAQAAIDEKRNELSSLTEARVTGAGETAGDDEGGEDVRESRTPAERPKTASLDQDIDRQLGISE